MRYRVLGRTGVRVSELFLGAMSLPDATTARRVVDAYLDAGGNVIDTASAYGDSESFLGEVLTRRDRVVLATKYTLTRDPTDPNAGGNHRSNLVASLQRSLRRLRTDHIDLLWVHTWDRHTAIEETLRALDDQVRAGTVRYIGMSDTPAWVVSRADVLARWHGWTPFAGVQVPYGPLNRDVERDVLPMATELGLTVAAWGVLDHGALTGSGRVPTSTPRQARMVATLNEIAVGFDASPAQVAIAWTRARWSVVHPLIGMRSADRMADCVAALDLTLPADAIAAIDDASGFEPGPYPDFLTETADHHGVFGVGADPGHPGGRRY